jgi:hypothetical protein
MTGNPSRSDARDCRKRNSISCQRIKRQPAILRPVLRLSPRLVALLLWCAIALLPLRGLAAAWMSGSMATTPVATASAEAALPCHAATPADDGSAADAAPLCTACDLCHAGVTVAPVPAVLADAPAAAAPDEALPSHHGRVAPDALFRPPR